MMANFHFLRPYWLLLLLPVVLLFIDLWRQNPQLSAWRRVCDLHLLTHLIKNKKSMQRRKALFLFMLSMIFFSMGLAGPTWIRLPVPTYQFNQPKIVLLDMSDNMLQNDIKPDRLTRAKFKLHDLLTHPDSNQWGLIAFTDEAFVVSPLTDDANTIDTLLSSITPNIMPVGGHNLAKALAEGAKLIKQAGFSHGQLLLLTATPPEEQAVTVAGNLAKQHIFTSVMPLTLGNAAFFQSLATAGQGKLLTFNDRSDNLYQWLKNTHLQQSYQLNQDNDIPVWKDEGRWFLLPGLILLLPVFRRNWLQRMDS